MQDLALIVSLMLFIPIVVGLLALAFAIYSRAKGKLRRTAIGFTIALGILAGWGFATYPLIGLVPFILLIPSALFLFVPKR